MADIESELRNCLNRHAASALPAPTLAADVRARSRRLSRRNQSVAALAMVPVTAGIAVGGVAIANAGGASSNGQVAKVQTAASKSPKPKPTPARITLDTCQHGTVPKLKATGGVWKNTHHRPVSMHALIKRDFHLTPKARQLKDVDYLRVIGHRPDGTKVLAIEVLNRAGQRHWIVSNVRNGQFHSHAAEFLGCTPKSGS